MTTTNEWLQTQDASHLAFSLVFEGYDLVLTTSNDTAGIATAFSATDWATVKSGLRITGTVGQEIELFKPRVALNGLSFSFVDADGTIRRLLLGSLSTDAVTYAKDDLSVSATSWNVLGTGDFAASGTIYSGPEAIGYTSKSGAPDPSFNGLTRGKWSLWGTSSSDSLGRVHRGQVSRSLREAGPSATPEIRDNPNVWYNRAVALLQHHLQPDGTWSTVTLPLHEADVRVAWAGRIKEWADLGDGSIEISCLSINELLTSTVFADQYEAELANVAGYFRQDESAMQIEYSAPTGGTVVPYGYNGALSPTTGWADGFYAFDDLMAMIQEQLNTWTADGSIPRSGSNPYHRWAVELRQTSEGLRVVFEVECLSGATFPTANASLHISLHPKVWNTLGFEQGHEYTEGGDRLARLALSRASSTVFYLIGKSAPRIGVNPARIRVGDYIPVINETGTWMVQPTIPAEFDDDSEGYVQIGDRHFNVLYDPAVSYNNGQVTVAAFKVLHAFQPPSPDADGNIDIRATIEESAEPARVKQVWVERGSVGELLAKVMLSTGSAGHNEPDLDVYASGFGIGVPYQLVDVNTFLSMETPYELFLERPTPFKELLEEVCHVYGRHIIMADGRITLTRPGFDSPDDLESILTLDEDSKSETPGRPEVRYSSEGIVNRIELVYNSLQVTRQTPDPNSVREFTSVSRVSNRITVADATSESAFGHRRTLQIAAKGILDPEAWAEYVAKPIITYFSRPFAVITRTISARASHLVPGDLVLLTDNYVVDPSVGERGSAGLACWVKSVEFDWTRGAGRATLVFLPDHDASRMRRYSPCARIASYNAGTKTLTLEDHAYSRSTDAVDASWFEASDIVQIRELSPSNPASPSVQTDVVASQSGSTVTLTTGVTLAGGVSYVLESVPVTSSSSPTTDQRSRAFLADETRLIDDAYPAARWSGSTKSLDQYITGRTYDQQFVVPADGDGAEDEPLSPRKLIDAMANCNVLLSYGTRNVLVNHVQDPGITTTSTSYVLVWGPAWVPLYGLSPDSPFRRKIKAKVRTDGSNALYTATYRLTSSFSPPLGSSMTGVTFPAYARSSTATYGPLLTTVQWLDIPEFVPAVTMRDGQIGTYLSLEHLVSNASMTQEFLGLAVVELELTI